MSAALDDLLACFWEYERALQRNDAEALAGWFAATPEVLRSDPAGTLVGHGEIAAFRRGRPPMPPRTIERLHVRRLAEAAALVVAETVSVDGSGGVQTQAWERQGGGWRIVAAHVSARQGPAVGALELGPDVWRVPPRDGAPLLAGVEGGPLSGVRVAVKDVFAVAGQRIGAGTPSYLAGAPTEANSCPAVQALVAAGADIVGIAQMDELAFSLAGTNPHYGTPANPAAAHRTTGGSSSGCAAAVAAGAADLGLGTDTAGSIRVPASYCGLYGLRTTQGMVDRTGVLGLARSFDSVSLLARDPATLTAALATLPPSPSASTPGRGRALKGAHLDGVAITRCVVVDELAGLADEGVRISFDAAVLALCGRRGLNVERMPSISGGQLDGWAAAFRLVQAVEAWQTFGGWIENHPGALGAVAAARFEAGRSASAAAASAARATLAECRAVLAGVVAPGTALLLPATSGPAPLRTAAPAELEAVRDATVRMTCLASIGGLPALVAPLLRCGALPVGLCAVGAAGSDGALAELFSFA